MIAPPVVRIPAPVPTADPPRSGFPLVATLAPLALSGVMFAVTGSPFMLLMALLSPVVAVAALADGLRQRRRARRDDAVRFRAELATAADRVGRAQQTERRRLAAFADLAPDWSRPGDEVLEIAVGRGDAPSGVELTGGTEARVEPRELESLRASAPVLDAAPQVRDLRRGAVVDGPPVLAAAVARALTLRLAARLSPATTALHAPPGESWARALPHAVEEGPAGGYRFRDGDGADIPIVWSGAASEGAVPVDARTGDAATRATAAREARRLAAAAESRGTVPADAALPALVRLGDLLSDDPFPGLGAPIGVDGHGVVALDLVADGPHAVVAGTTGSGKSELLVSWVLGMAHRRSPDEVAFVLVDFKGGAAFAPLEGLPHVLGTLSDLDERLARRAVESLRAEVLRRERMLAAAGARGIADLATGSLARLVVVVDEFAALVAERPELHAVFADLAARGRSLGIHLILCTQRPAGVVRDAVLANVAVRIALRVADRSDSLGLLGDDAAARLPASARGRAVVVDGTGPARLVQLALASPADVARVAGDAAPGTATRPWHDPLPALVRHRDLPTAEGLRFGLLDLPAEQRQPVAAVTARHGHLLVLGAPGSGVSVALAALAADAGDAARRLPADPVGLWHALADPAVLTPGRVLLADDLDLTLARCGPEYAPELGELLSRLLREAPARGIRVIGAARRLAGPMTALAPFFGSRLLLRLGSREEHVLAGGDGALFDPRAMPGAGNWDGMAVQVAVPDARAIPEVETVPPPVVALGSELAVVAARPATAAAHWAAAGVRVRQVGVADLEVAPADPSAILWLGDPDAWQSDWNALSRARRELRMVFHGCTPADVRAIARPRESPPPLAPGEVWLVENGRVLRARVPPPS